MITEAPIPPTKKFRSFHGNYCGKGNRGGIPVDRLDKACLRHDVEYHKSYKDPDRQSAKQTRANADAHFVTRTTEIAKDKSNATLVRFKARVAATVFGLKRKMSAMNIKAPQLKLRTEPRTVAEMFSMQEARQSPDALKKLYPTIDTSHDPLGQHKTSSDIIDHPLSILAAVRNRKSIKEDAPANATGAAVAGTGSDTVHWSKRQPKMGRHGDRPRKYGQPLSFSAFIRRKTPRNVQEGDLIAFTQKKLGPYSAKNLALQHARASGIPHYAEEHPDGWKIHSVNPLDDPNRNKFQSNKVFIAHPTGKIKEL